MENIEEQIPIIWKKPHNSSNTSHIGIINNLLNKLINKYQKRLQIRQVIIDFKMPKDAAGLSNKTFIIKIHLQLKSGKFLRAESEKRSVEEAMKNITDEIENQSYLTDRQKHHDSSRKLGE